MVWPGPVVRPALPLLAELAAPRPGGPACPVRCRAALRLPPPQCPRTSSAGTFETPATGAMVPKSSVGSLNGLFCQLEAASVPRLPPLETPGRPATMALQGVQTLSGGGGCGAAYGPSRGRYVGFGGEGRSGRFTASTHARKVSARSPPK